MKKTQKKKPKKKEEDEDAKEEKDKKKSKGKKFGFKAIRKTLRNLCDEYPKDEVDAIFAIYVPKN